jgi:hypothetical protein
MAKSVIIEIGGFTYEYIPYPPIDDPNYFKKQQSINMKNFPEPMVTISLEEYNSLKESAKESMMNIFMDAIKSDGLKWEKIAPSPFGMPSPFISQAIVKTMKLEMNHKAPVELSLIVKQ